LYYLLYHFRDIYAFKIACSIVDNTVLGIGPIFICLAAVGSQICYKYREIPREFELISGQGHPRSSYS